MTKKGVDCDKGKCKQTADIFVNNQLIEVTGAGHRTLCQNNERHQLLFTIL